MSDEKATDSIYPPLVRPTFHSAVPKHLIEQMEEKDRYMVSQMSIMEQQNEWIISAVVECNRSIRELDIGMRSSRAQLELRLQTAEQWQRMVMSKWAVVVVLAGILGMMFLQPIARSVYEFMIPPTHRP